VDWAANVAPAAAIAVQLDQFGSSPSDQPNKISFNQSDRP